MQQRALEFITCPLYLRQTRLFALMGAESASVRIAGEKESVIQVDMKMFYNLQNVITVSSVS